MAGGTHAVTLAKRIFLAQYEFSGDANADSVGVTVELKDDPRYGDTYKHRKVGLADMSFSIAGSVDYSGAEDQDTIMNSKMRVQDVPLIITATDNVAVGAIANFGLVVAGQYNPQFQHGDVAKYTLTGNLGTRKWVRGKILWSPSTQVTGTANGSEVSLGAVSATQKLYVALCVFADNFSSLTVKVQSDTTGFPTPTDQVTFTNTAANTAEMPTPVNGPITDTFYRASVSTFTGTSASIIVVAGIA